MKKNLTKKQGDGNVAVAERTRNAATYTPRFDIVETDDELVLYGDLPGVTKETWTFASKMASWRSRQSGAATHRSTSSSTGNTASATSIVALPSARHRRREDLRRTAQRCVDAALAEDEAVKPRKIAVKAGK